MQALDLLRHTPDQFLGKMVTINDRNYRLGALFRDSDQGYSHFLVNEVSGLCLHILQIRKEYMSSPEHAKQASESKAKATAAFRSQMKQEANPVEIPLITVIEANGGNFELHEIALGDFGSAEQKPEDATFIRVGELLKVNDFTSAKTELDNLLAELPNHTVALNNLASCHSSLNNLPAALEVLGKAIAIEPNYMLYQANRAMVAMNCNRHREALSYFRQLKAGYPQLEDYDYYGIHLYLRCGATEEASELLRTATLSKQHADELSSIVFNAMAAQKQYKILENDIRIHQTFTKKTLDSLAKIYPSYSTHPLIQANLGFALFREGNYGQAQQLLMMAANGIAEKWVVYCWANAAFCLIKQGECASAMHLLNVTMVVLKSMYPNLDYGVAPGIVNWLLNDGVMESISPSAADVVDYAINSCPDKNLITDEVRQLAALYRQAAENYSNLNDTSAIGVNQNVTQESSKCWWRHIWSRPPPGIGAKGLFSFLYLNSCYKKP